MVKLDPPVDFMNYCHLVLSLHVGYILLPFDNVGLVSA